MAASFTLPTVLANLAAGNQALSLIDGDLTTLRDPLLSLNTFSNYYTDIGAANAYAITVSSPQTVTQAPGLRVQFIATNANTAASTLQINALAVKSIKNLNGTALAAGQIPANGIADVIYDGTQYLLLSMSFPPFTPITNSLSGDVALNNTGTYFTGPTVAQGTAGTWLATGNAEFTGNAADIINVKLWDGTTVIDSGLVEVSASGRCPPIHLSGFIASPAGNIRISANDQTSTNGLMKFNASGNSKDSTITAVRIA